MTASWWDVFWPLWLTLASLVLVAASVTVAVVVPVRAVLTRDTDWADTITTVIAFLLTCAGLAGAWAGLAALGIA